MHIKQSLFFLELLSHENATTLNDVKTLVQQLYTALCIEEHQLNKEKELIGRLEELKEQLAPLEKVRSFSLYFTYPSNAALIYFKVLIRSLAYFK